jgi:hypothetical protein
VGVGVREINRECVYGKERQSVCFDESVYV